MEEEKIKEILKKKKEIFIFEIQLISKKIVQAVKLVGNTVEFIYYEEKEGNLIKIEDEDTLDYLKEQYELKKSPIIYDRRNLINNGNERVIEQQNERIKELVKSYIVDELSGCDLFTSVFGENFARRNIKNIKKVVLKEKKEKNPNAGIYDIEDGSISIFVEPEVFEDLSYIDTEDEEWVKAVLLHESIHALLKRSHTETGLMVSFGQDKEIGRALNEGYTDWIVKKVGLVVDPEDLYKRFLDIVEKIELAIGEKNTMRLGKRFKYFNKDDVYIKDEHNGII